MTSQSAGLPAHCDHAHRNHPRLRCGRRAAAPHPSESIVSGSTMQRYIMMRLSLAVPTILGAVTLVFFAMQLAPGDPASLFIPPDLPPADSAALEQRINDKYGFDDSLPVQYSR